MIQATLVNNKYQASFKEISYSEVMTQTKYNAIMKIGYLIKEPRYYGFGTDIYYGFNTNSYYGYWETVRGV